MSDCAYVIVEWRLDERGEIETVYQSKKGRSFVQPPMKDCWKTQDGAYNVRNKILHALGLVGSRRERFNVCDWGKPIGEPHENTTGRYLAELQKEFWKKKVLENESRINDLEKMVERLRSRLVDSWEDL